MRRDCFAVVIALPASPLGPGGRGSPQPLLHSARPAPPSSPWPRRSSGNGARAQVDALRRRDQGQGRRRRVSSTRVCKDMCPLATARLGAAAGQARRCGSAATSSSRSISIEPGARHAASCLKQYADAFRAGPGWLFLTGLRAPTFRTRSATSSASAAQDTRRAPQRDPARQRPHRRVGPRFGLRRSGRIGQ